MILHYSFIHTLGGTGWSPSRGSPDVEPPQPVVMGGLTCMGVGQTHTQACLTYLPLTDITLYYCELWLKRKRRQQVFCCFPVVFQLVISRIAQLRLRYGCGTRRTQPASCKSPGQRLPGASRITEASQRTLCSRLSQLTAPTGVAAHH